MTKLRIFAASAQDMAAERAKVETVAAMLKPLADYLDITLEVIDWRSIVPHVGRPEQVILDQLKPGEWDVFIGIVWHRLAHRRAVRTHTRREITCQARKRNSRPRTIRGRSTAGRAS